VHVQVAYVQQRTIPVWRRANFFPFHNDCSKEVIIYDDNLLYRSLSQTKRKIYIFLLSLLKARTLPRVFETFIGRVFFIENHPGVICSALHDAFSHGNSLWTN
jgi:hypothetical protein